MSEAGNDIVKTVAKQAAQSILDVATGDYKQYTCPECNGKKFVKATGQPKFKVCSGTVSAINAFTCSDGAHLLYLVDDDSINHNIDETQLWTNRDEAEKRCAFLNLERKHIPIENVKIPPYFAKSIPRNSKLIRRLDEWRKKKKFDIEIYVDSQSELFDGYTAYLIYKMLGKAHIPVVIWPNKPN